MSTALPRRRRLRSYLRFVKFEHTLFALPFAYAGMLLAAAGRPGWATFAWVSLAMVGARTAAMALNRVVDAAIDARNPRTADREIPSGRLGVADGLALAAAGLALLGVAAWRLNPLTMALLPVAVLFLVLYPYTKRVTWLCHLWLGVTIGAAAAGGWIAVTGAFAPAAVALWVGVGLWIAGFDVIYALLDLDFDRAHGVHSVPARFGPRIARRIAALAHAAAWLALAAALPLAPALGWGYAVALVLVGAVLVAAHRLVRARGAGAALAAFNANLVVSGLVLAGVLADLYLLAGAPA